jgi:hypothetical protein
MSAWERYLAAAQRLDVVRRNAAAAVAEQSAAVSAAREELTGVRHRLALQHSRLVDLAGRAGLPPPSLPPGPPVPDPAHPAAAVALLRGALSELDAADAALSEVDTPQLTQGPFPDWPPALRNIAVYGAFAIAVLIAQLVLYVTSGDSGPAAGVGALLCGASLPALGYGLSWISVGLLYGKVDRTPVLGAAVSAFPVVLLCAGIGAMAMLR